MRSLFIFGFVIILLGVIAVMQNSQPVELHFLFFKGEISMALALFASLLGGMLIAVFLGFPLWYSKRKQLRLAKKELKTSRESINELKAQLAD